MRKFMAGEMESLGSVIRRCLEATEHGKYYRPNRPFRHGRVKRDKSESGQMSFNFSEPIRQFNSTAITPNNPITDDDVPF